MPQVGAAQLEHALRVHRLDIDRHRSHAETRGVEGATGHIGVLVELQREHARQDAERRTAAELREVELRHLGAALEVPRRERAELAVLEVGAERFADAAFDHRAVEVAVDAAVDHPARTLRRRVGRARRAFEVERQVGGDEALRLDMQVVELHRGLADARDLAVERPARLEVAQFDLVAALRLDDDAPDPRLLRPQRQHPGQEARRPLRRRLVALTLLDAQLRDIEAAHLDGLPEQRQRVDAQLDVAHPYRRDIMYDLDAGDAQTAGERALHARHRELLDAAEALRQVSCDGLQRRLRMGQREQRRQRQRQQQHEQDQQQSGAALHGVRASARS